MVFGTALQIQSCLFYWQAADSAAHMHEVSTLVTISAVLSQDLYICQHNFSVDPITEKVQILISAYCANSWNAILSYLEFDVPTLLSSTVYLHTLTYVFELCGQECID